MGSEGCFTIKALFDTNKKFALSCCAYLSENNQNSVRTKIFSRIGQEAVAKFRIGVAPYNYSDWFKDKDLAQACGLLKYNDDGSVFSVFNRRIVIPIVHAGRVVAFAGRAINDSAKVAKYINSRSSPIYNKSEVLFGLWHARKYILACGYVIIVEGYFDWLKLFSAGIKNVVALGGISLTKSHILHLKRYCNQMCILTDGDKAGAKAAIKISETLKDAHLPRKIVNLPAGLDPDEAVVKFGVKKFMAVLNKEMQHASIN